MTHEFLIQAVIFGIGFAAGLWLDRVAAKFDRKREQEERIGRINAYIKKHSPEPRK